MMAPFAFLARLGGDSSGSTVIETALVLPPILLLSLGTFDISKMVARQAELQKAANEASDIVRASTPDTTAKRATIKSVIMSSTGLATDKVTLSVVYRCDTETAYVTTSDTCDEDTTTYYIKLVLSDTYTPTWTKFGVSNALNYSVTRYVQIG